MMSRACLNVGFPHASAKDRSWPARAESLAISHGRERPVAACRYSGKL